MEKTNNFRRKRESKDEIRLIEEMIEGIRRKMVIAGLWP